MDTKGNDLIVVGYLDVGTSSKLVTNGLYKTMTMMRMSIDEISLVIPNFELHNIWSFSKS